MAVKTKKNKKKKISSSNPKKIKIFGYSISRRLITVILIILISVAASAKIPTTQVLSSQSSSVLGDEDEREEEKEDEDKREEEKKEEKSVEKQKEEQKKQEEVKREEIKQQEQKKSIQLNNPRRSNTIKTKTESVSSNGDRMKIEVEGDKEETEIETRDGQKIKTKVEDDGTTKIEVENGSVKLKYVIENGVAVVKAENEDGEEVELEEDELEEMENELEQELEDEGIQITTSSGRPVFIRNSVGASTDFPLSVDTVTRQLIITTPQGQKIITILPDEAVKNVIGTGIVNVVDTSDGNLPEGSFSEDVVKLTVRDDEAVYEVRGTKKQKLFGFIPVTTSKKVIVSAETGAPLLHEQSVLANITDFLSTE